MSSIIDLASNPFSSLDAIAKDIEYIATLPNSPQKTAALKQLEALIEFKKKYARP